MISGDDKWHQVALALNTAIYNALPSGSRPCRSGVVPGAIAWDDCTCGILATSWAQTFLSEVIPQETVTVIGNCEAPWETSEFVMQLIRCAPLPDSSGNAPTVSALTAAARVMAVDGNIMERVASQTLCEMKDQYQIADYLVRRRTSVGPEGGCVGNELRILVGLPRG